MENSLINLLKTLLKLKMPRLARFLIDTKQTWKMRGLYRASFQIAPRDVFHLEFEPPLMVLHKASDFLTNSTSLDSALRSVYTSAIREDLPSLYTTSFSARFPSGTRSAKIDCRNTQFISLNRSIEEYSAGYEPPLLCILDLLLSDTATFLDIGSNWGYLSFYLASRKGFNGKIYSFEPMPRAFSDLESLVDQLGCQNIITPYRMAVSDTNGSAWMEMGREIHSGLAAIHDGNSGVEVTTTTIDSLGLDQCNFIKIDVEGHESKVVRGAVNLIKKTRPLVYFENLLIKVSDYQASTAMETISILDGLEYDFYVPTWNSGDLKLISCPITHRSRFPANINILAVPKEKTPIRVISN
jgi:FkbM family methyltransferase